MAQRSDRERLDDLQIGGYRIWQDPALFCFGIDAVLLSAFVRVPEGARVCDLGTGNGVLLFLLAAKTQAASLTGLELAARPAELAEKSIETNGLKGRVSVVRGDLCEASAIFGEACFDAVVSNPPYRKPSDGRVSPVPERAMARHEVAMTLRELVRETARILKDGGSFFAVYPAVRREELERELRAAGLSPVRVREVRSFPEKPAHLILLEAVKGAGACVTEAPLIIYDAQGVYSAEVRAIYGGSV